MIWRLGRQTTFFYDEWNFLLDRRTGWLDALLEPHNGHLSALPVLIYRVLFWAVGTESYAFYRVVGLAAHVLVSSLVALVVARRTANAWVGVAAGSIILFLGSGWQNILWPFQIGFLGSIAATLCMMLCLERRARRADIVAGVLLAAVLACSGLGVPALIAAAVILLVQGSHWRRYAVIGVPALAYALWYMSYGDSQAKASNLGAALRFNVDAAAGAISGLGGMSLGAGRVLLCIVVLALVVALWKRRRLPALGAGAATFLLTFWTLAALSRADAGDPLASRYVYVGAVFILVLAAALCPPLLGRCTCGDLPARRRVGRVGQCTDLPERSRGPTGSQPGAFG